MPEDFPPFFKMGKPSLAALPREPHTMVGVGEGNKSRRGEKSKGRVMAATSGGAVAAECASAVLGWSSEPPLRRSPVENELGHGCHSLLVLARVGLALCRHCEVWIRPLGERRRFCLQANERRTVVGVLCLPHEAWQESGCRPGWNRDTTTSSFLLIFQLILICTEAVRQHLEPSV